MSPTSEKNLARLRKRLIDAGMRTWYGSRANDTTLAELVAAMRADDYTTAPRGPAGPAVRRYLLAGLIVCGRSPAG